MRRESTNDLDEFHDARLEGGPKGGTRYENRGGREAGDVVSLQAAKQTGTVTILGVRGVAVPVQLSRFCEFEPCQKRDQAAHAG